MREDLQVYLFLFIGSLCMFLASLLAGNVEWVPGTTSTSFYGTLFVAFVLILIAGIFWVSSARLLRPSSANGARKHSYEDTTTPLREISRSGEARKHGYEGRKRGYGLKEYDLE